MTLAEFFMNQAALGFRAHSGWTSLVAIALEDRSPMVLVRQRPQLVKTFTYEFRQPYHTAEMVPRAEAQGVVSRIRTEARTLAYKAIHSVQKNLLAQGYVIKYCGLLLASGRPLPSLPKILESHALIHTADGELFRDALLHASKRCGFETLTVKERELLEKASELLRLKGEAISRLVAHLGVGLGPPWTQDEKLAALIAWLSLVQSMPAPNRAQNKTATPDGAAVLLKPTAN
jgi:hypothetical protein